MTATSKTTPVYFNSIQFLRFFAALYVVLFHISSPWNHTTDLFTNLFNSGYGAIDLFFVISGFVVLQSGDTSNTGPRASGEFLKRRFIRLYPIYWVFLFLFLVAGLVQIKTTTIGGFGRSFFLLPGHKGIIGTSWTLQYELYFYILIALFVLNRRFKWLLVMLFALSLISMAGVIIASLFDRHFPVYGFYNEYVANFFLGCVVYVIYNRISASIATGLLVAGVLLFFFMPITIYLRHFISFGIPAAMLLAGLTALENHQKIKINRWFVLLGNASYCLYLIHVPIIWFVWKQIGPYYENNRLLLLLEVATMVVLSVLLYQYFEAPLLRFLNKRLAGAPARTKKKEVVT
jgi:peptidoglycan/LPS O-acetylase OafA/YrhL